MLTIEYLINKTTNEFAKWVGYTEKKSSTYIKGRTYDNPGPFNEGAGYSNYTIFAEVYKEKTGINVQAQAWCDTFVDTIYIHLYGVDMAKSLLGGFSAYTPTSANYFKQMGKYSKTPQAGSIIFFHNGTRIYHTGYVYNVDSKYVYTIEGNTSTGDNVVVENGGGVAMKKYTRTNSKIDGYGMPDYGLIIASQLTYVDGWMKAADNKRWWYQFSDGTYAVATDQNHGWYIIGNHYYLFDKNGYMLTGNQTDYSGDGKHYLLANYGGSDEGKLLTTNYSSDGSLEVFDISREQTHFNRIDGWELVNNKWRFKLSSGEYMKATDADIDIFEIRGRSYALNRDGDMCTGFITINNKLYYFDEFVDQGAMLTTYGNPSTNVVVYYE